MASIFKHIFISFLPFLDIENTVLSFLLLIDAKVYGLIAKLYSLFIDLARARIFSDDLYQNVVTKLYAIIGVVSLFVIAYSLLNLIINPENTSNKDKNGVNILKNFLISLVLIALIPTIFEFLYSFQNAILSYNTIPKLFFNDTSSSNSNKETVYFQDGNGNPIFTADCQASSLEEAERTCTKYTIEVEYDNLKNYGYELSYIVLSGFIHPANGYDNTIYVDASRYFGLDTGMKLAIAGCLIGGAIATTAVVALEVVTSPETGFATAAAIPGTISAFSGSIAAACYGGAVIGGVGVNGIGYMLTVETFRWSNVETEIKESGNFEYISAFPQAIYDGELDYIPIVSTICGLILLYMIASFCLDLGVRAAKLTFYEIFAPISFLLGVIPSNKNMVGNWVKSVLTTWAEVFTRILCLCGLAYLISNLNEMVFGYLDPLAKAIIVMGLVTFAKQLPKLIGDMTGIKSDNMKLGIMDKLREGGALTAGAIIGGGITTGVNNLTSAGKKIRNKWKEDTENNVGTKKKAWNAVRGTFGGLLSGAAGTISGGARGYKSGKDAKNLGDMKNAAGKAAREAGGARSKRENYKASHGGNAAGVFFGHVGDAIQDIGEWATGGVYEAYKDELELYDSLMADATKVKETSENLIRKKMHMFTITDKTGPGFALRDAAGNILSSSDGTLLKFDSDASLGEISDVVKALISSGNVRDAQLAHRLNNEIEKRIKNVAKELQDASAKSDFRTFNASFMATEDEIQDKQAVEVQEILSQYTTLLEKVQKNAALSGVKKFVESKGPLTPTNVSDLADALDIERSEINEKIRKQQAKGRGKSGE